MNIIRYFFIFCFLSVSCSIAAFFFFLHNNVVDLGVLEHYNPGKPTILLDDEGNEWARFSFDQRKPISLQTMSPYLTKAFIAAEDHAFFHHQGISWKGIIRSFFVNLYHCRIVQGASTITQQLVKLLFTDSKRTFFRKIKDQVLALLVEQQFSKEHILQTYLNHVFFGGGIYGVEAASQRFWGKSAATLSLEESALLAAIVKNPSHYYPLHYPLSAQKRRNIVLHSMLQLQFITPEEYERARATPIALKSQEEEQCAPHLKEAIRIFLEKSVGKKTLYTNGLVVQTTLNRKMQACAEKAFKEQIAQLREKAPLIDGGLLTIDVKTGAIKALVGGYDFFTSKFNRVFQARRQMGSIFKPLIYAIALEQGMYFEQTEVDEPLYIKTASDVWKPRNHARTFEGEMTLARALAHSNNIIAVKTLLSVGYDPVIALAKKCGVQGSMLPYPSLALGCVDGTLKEMVGMFNIFANNGVYVEPHYIRWVKDEWGQKIVTVQPAQERVLSPHISGQVARVLSIGLERARKKNGNVWLDTEALGKTGTTNRSRTCNFVGSTPEFTTGVYLGADKNESLGYNVYAVRTAFPIWRNFYAMLPNTKKKFSYDSSLREHIIHGRTGELLADPSHPQALAILC